MREMKADPAHREPRPEPLTVGPDEVTPNSYDRLEPDPRVERRKAGFSWIPKELQDSTITLEEWKRRNGLSVD